MTALTGLAQGQQHHRGPIRRVDAVLGGPVWWACHLGGMYWLVPRSCTWDAAWPMHVLTIVLVALTARAFLSGLQVMRAGKAAPDETGRRDFFIGWVGISFSLFFGAVTIAEWIPLITLHPCM